MRGSVVGADFSPFRLFCTDFFHSFRAVDDGVIVNGMGDVTKATAGVASDRRARAKYCFIIEHDEIKARE